MYNVKIEQFEGPFDLLLEIIEQKKLPLVEVSLSSVTEQFLEHLRALPERKLDDVVDFLVVASRLAYAKSRELVPGESDQDEGEGSTTALEQSLALYQPFRRSAKLLLKRLRSNRKLYVREAFAGFPNTFYFPSGLSAIDLTLAIKDVAENVVFVKKIPQASMQSILSMEDCINELVRLCGHKDEPVSFSGFIKEKKREERLVHFLASLELVRQGTIKAAQKVNFGTIMIARSL